MARDTSKDVTHQQTMSKLSEKSKQTSASLLNSTKVAPKALADSGDMDGVLGKIYQLMVDNRQDELAQRVIDEKNSKTDAGKEEQRHQELLKALTIRRRPKPKRVIRREKKAEEKEARKAPEPTKPPEAAKKPAEAAKKPAEPAKKPSEPAKKPAEDTAKKAAEDKVKKEAEDKAKKAAEDKAKKEAEDKAKKESQAAKDKADKEAKSAKDRAEKESQAAKEKADKEAKQAAEKVKKEEAKKKETATEVKPPEVKPPPKAEAAPAAPKPAEVKPPPKAEQVKPPPKAPSIPSGGLEGAKQMVMQHEGKINYPYKDSKGLWTIGVGHLIQPGGGTILPPEYAAYKDNGGPYDKKNNKTPAMTDAQVMELFEKDFQHHKEIAMKTPNWNLANETGQAAMIDLAFNMGEWWNTKSWKNSKAVKGLKEGDFKVFADNMEDSLWYKQVGNRAVKIVDMIRKGKKTSVEQSSTPMPPASNTGTKVDQSSKENAELKEKLNKDNSTQTTNNTTTTNNQTNNVKPEQRVDDRPPHIRKQQQ